MGIKVELHHVNRANKVLTQQNEFYRKIFYLVLEQK